MKQKNNKGITLITLIITIIVLLILAAVAIAAIKGDGIISHAKNAKSQYSEAQENELTLLKEYEKNIENEVISKKEEQSNIEITVGEAKVTLTKENVAAYLGKVVTNYRGKSSVTIDSSTYYASIKYRLYYVDFDNKYGDGKGTIYLKADCSNKEYTFPTTDTTAATEPNIKIKNLNPELYKEGVTAPSKDNTNMKAVTWLTNSTNWEGLKTSDTTLASKVNYIVGAPSLEMMIDSYNTHYKLTGDTPDTTAITAGERRKLFYKYTTGASGYEVGPGGSGTKAAYSSYTLDNSICTDSAIDSMYYPGANRNYWLASPSSENEYAILLVETEFNNIFWDVPLKSSFSLCPLVSLESSANLILAE